MTTKEFIKKRLMEELTNKKPKKMVVGVLIKCTETDNVFLLYRNDKTPVWALVSGGLDQGEDPIEGLNREIYEELFIRPGIISFKPIRIEQLPEKNMEFHYYEGFTNSEFKPILDHENLNYLWCDINHLPSPLYKGLKEKIISILK